MVHQIQDLGNELCDINNKAKYIPYIIQDYLQCARNNINVVTFFLELHLHGTSLSQRNSEKESERNTI